MSFILDALNKAQREREEQSQPVPQLSTVHYTPPAGTAPVGAVRPSGIVMIAGLVAIAVVALGAGYWLMAGDVPSAEPAAETAAAVAAPSPVMPAASAELEPNPIVTPVASSEVEPSIPENGAAAPGADSAAPPAEVANLYQAARAAPVPAPARTETQMQNVASSTADTQTQDPAVQAAEALARIRALHQARSVSASQSVKPQPPEAQSQIQTQTQIQPAVQAEAQSQANIRAPDPEPAPQNSIASRIDVPFVQELSWSLQQTLPTINYSAHNYSADGERSVDINGTTYRTGSQIGGGLVVEEILSDGIILRFRGQAVKLRALNSWVNF